MRTVLAQLEIHLRETVVYAHHLPLMLHAAQNCLSTTLPLARLSSFAPTLVELHLPHNRLKVINGLEALTVLQVLDLSHNQITKASHLRSLSFNSQLGSLSLRENPLALSLTERQLRITMLHLLPSLWALDGKPFFSPSSFLAPVKKKPRAASIRVEITDEANSYLALHRAAKASFLARTEEKARLPRYSLDTEAERARLAEVESTKRASLAWSIQGWRETSHASLPPQAPATGQPARPRYIPPWRRPPHPTPRGWRNHELPGIAKASLQQQQHRVVATKREDQALASAVARNWYARFDLDI